jgi:hypothetical protein
MKMILPTLRQRRLASRRLVSVAGLLLPLLAGCSSFLPSTALPVPVLRHAGQLQASVTDGSFGISGTAAGAITDNIGFSGLFSTNSQHDELSASSYSAGEGMVIFSTPFSGGSVLELGAGAGAGRTNYADYSSDLHGLFTRFFAQATFASTLDAMTRKDTATPFIEGGVMLRASRYDFHDVYSSGWSTDLPGATFLEPGLFVRTVWGMFSVGGQVGFEIGMGDTGNIPHANTQIALEFGVRFGDESASTDRE